jgi:hypothetical protein
MPQPPQTTQSPFGSFTITDEDQRIWRIYVIIEPDPGGGRPKTLMCRSEMLNARGHIGNHSPLHGCQTVLAMANLALSAGVDPQKVLMSLIGNRNGPQICKTLRYPEELLVDHQEPLEEPLTSLVGRYARWLWGRLGELAQAVDGP